MKISAVLTATTTMAQMSPGGGGTGGISSSDLQKLMNGEKIVKKWVFHHETGLTWTQATLACRKAGGVLAYFDDGYDHIQALKQVPMDARFWVGYSDLALEGFWKTVTNKVPSYLRWIEDQPDNRLEDEDCGLVVMGPWGRGRMMDANCHAPNGIEEWTVPVGHMCRFDSKPERMLLDEDRPEEEYQDELEEEEEELLPRDMPVPDWAKDKGPKKLELTDKLVEKIKKGAGLSSGTAVDKYTDMVKEQLKETELMTKTFDTLQTEFDALHNITAGIRGDNTRIFAELAGLKGEPIETSAVISSVPATENNYWIDRQKKINHGFVSGFERQKERLSDVEDEFDMLWGNFTESGIVEFMQEQEEENKYLREEITQLAYTNEKITQSMSFMTEQFAKVFETLKFLTQQRGPAGRPSQAPRAMSAPPTQENETESD